MGFEIEASHHEVADSQHEIDFKYGDALVTTADRVITLQVCNQVDCPQVRAARSLYGKTDCWDQRQRYAHARLAVQRTARMHSMIPMARIGYSDTAIYYIGGLLKHAKAITRVANPTINSYKRLVPGYEAPCYISWSTSKPFRAGPCYLQPGVTAPVPNSAVRTRCATRTSRLPACLQQVLTVSRIRLCHRKARIRTSIISTRRTERDSISICFPDSLMEANAALAKRRSYSVKPSVSMLSRTLRASLRWKQIHSGLRFTHGSWTRYLATY